MMPQEQAMIIIEIEKDWKELIGSGSLVTPAERAEMEEELERLRNGKRNKQLWQEEIRRRDSSRA